MDVTTQHTNFWMNFGNLKLISLARHSRIPTEFRLDLAVNILRSPPSLPVEADDEMR